MEPGTVGEDLGSQAGHLPRLLAARGAMGAPGWLCQGQVGPCCPSHKYRALCIVGRREHMICHGHLHSGSTARTGAPTGAL